MGIRITLDTDFDDSAEGFANFIRDLVFIHDRLITMSLEREEPRRFYSPGFYARQTRIPDEYKLKVKHITKQSPTVIELVGLGLSSGLILKTFLEFIKVARDWKVDRRIKDLEKQKKDLEVQKLELEINDLTTKLELDEEGQNLMGKDLKRLAESDISIADVGTFS